MRALVSVLSRATTVGLAVLVSGCGSDEPESVEPVRPDPEVIQVHPPDLSTAVGSTPIQVVVFNGGSPVGETLLTQISQSIRLRSWPERAPVATATEVVDTSGASGEDQYAHISLTPASPLEDRWYSTLIESLPSGVSLSRGANLLALGQGAYASRFRTGSAPVVAAVRVDAKGPGSISLDFSEEVTGDSSVVAVSYADGGAPNCRPDPIAKGTGVTVGAGGATGSSEAASEAALGGSTIRFRCEPSVDLTRSLRFEIQPGLKAVSGRPVAGGDPLAFVVQPDAWEDFPDGGRAWKPPA